MIAVILLVLFCGSIRTDSNDNLGQPTAAMEIQVMKFMKYGQEKVRGHYERSEVSHRKVFRFLQAKHFVYCVI